MRSATIVTLCFLVSTLAGGFSGACHAFQDGRGKEIARDLLKALIESQLERQSGRSDFAQPPRPPQPTAEMQQVKTLLATMNQEATALTALLSTDARRSFDVRDHLSDGLSFQAGVAAARNRLDRETSHVAAQPVIQSLSQLWRPLAHDLSECPGVSSQSRECAGRIARLDQQLCQLLGIREQFNARELVRSADMLSADLRTLVDEVQYLGTPTPARTRLLSSLRRVQDRAAYFANLCAGGVQFQTAVAEYQGFYQAWQSVRPELDTISSRGVLRAVTRIQETQRTIHQILRLEYGPDLAALQRMSESLERELTELYRALTLEQLMTLPDSRSIPLAADTLLGMAHNLTDVVTRRESLQAVGEAWVFLDEQWQLMEFYLRPAAVAETRRRIEGISQSLASLKRAIGVSVAFDKAAIAGQAQSVESLVDILQSTVRRWTTRPGQQNPGLVAEVQGLLQVCREIETIAGAARDRSGLLTRSDQALVIWEQLRPKLSQCTTDEREALERLVESLTPALVQLRTMVDEQ